MLPPRAVAICRRLVVVRDTPGPYRQAVDLADVVEGVTANLPLDGQALFEVPQGLVVLTLTYMNYSQILRLSVDLGGDFLFSTSVLNPELMGTRTNESVVTF